MKALVTGASGFVGGYVVRALLQRGHHVTGLVRRENSAPDLVDLGMGIAVGDISLPASLTEPMRGQDVVIHLAAVVGKNPGGWDNHYAIGVQGTENVVEAAIGASVPRFVHLSSCIVYRAPGDDAVVTEESPLEHHIEPWNHYLRQKLVSEARVLERKKRIAITVVRPPTVVGPGDPNLISYLEVISRSPLGAVAKDGSHHFPLVLAEDLAAGIAVASAREGAEARVYNMAAKQAPTKDELFAALARAGATIGPGSNVRKLAAKSLVLGFDALELTLSPFGRKLQSLPRRISIDRLELHAKRRAQPNLVVDSSKAERELGFTTSADYEQAIRRAVAWNRTRNSEL